MKFNLSCTPSASLLADTGRRADVALYMQCGCILNLSNEPGRRRLSFYHSYSQTDLSGEEYLTMEDLTKKSGRSTASATGLVVRVENLDRMERTQDKEDRRKIMFRITRKGVELVSHMGKEIASDVASILSSMDVDVADTLDRTKRVMNPRLQACLGGV